MAIQLTPRHFTGSKQARSEIDSEGLGFIDAHVAPEQLSSTPHVHAYQVDIYLLEGVLELHEPDTGLTHRLEPGSKAVVPSDTLHSEYSPAGCHAMIGLPPGRIQPDPANSEVRPENRSVDEMSPEGETNAIQLAMLQEMVDALTAYVAVLDGRGSIVQVNDRLRRFGTQRGASRDYVGSNYLDVCAAAVGLGDVSAARVEKGLRKLLRGDIDTFGIAYHCADRTFRLRARAIDFPVGRIIVLHEDITALLRARRERNTSRLELTDARQEHASRVAHFHEELGQRLAAISLAAKALENGGCPTTAAAIIRMSVDEAMREVRLLRYDEA